MEVSNAHLTGDVITIGDTAFSLNRIKEILSNAIVSNSNTGISNAIFMGERITINGVSFSLNRLKQVLISSTNWDENITYSTSDFITYNGYCYVSLQNNNIGNQPVSDNDNVYWKCLKNNLTPQFITDNNLSEYNLQFNKEYIILLFNNIRLNLPQGQQGKRIKISAQFLNQNQSITIYPYYGDTVCSQDGFAINVSYGSVELIYIGNDWKVITPFAPITNTIASESVTEISNSDVLFLVQNGVQKSLTMEMLKSYINGAS